MRSCPRGTWRDGGRLQRPTTEPLEPSRRLQPSRGADQTARIGTRRAARPVRGPFAVAGAFLHRRYETSAMARRAPTRNSLASNDKSAFVTSPDARRGGRIGLCSAQPAPVRSASSARRSLVKPDAWSPKARGLHLHLRLFIIAS
jgi:hypothetical protein